MAKHRNRTHLGRVRDFTREERRRIHEWESQHKITVLDDYRAKMALRMFVQHGCEPLQLLDLLRVYSLGRSDTFKIAASQFEKTRGRVTPVVRQLRKAAAALRDLLPEGEPDDVDQILETADNLESYVKVIQALGIWGREYTKSFGGTLVYLVLASKLIMLRTGAPRSEKLVALLRPMLRKNQPNRSYFGTDAFRRQISRFEQRYPEVVDELTSIEKTEWTIDAYLEAWKRLEERIWKNKS